MYPDLKAGVQNKIPIQNRERSRTSSALIHMESLNRKATIVFGELLNRLDKGYLKIFNDPWMPLTMKLVREGIETPWGNANQFSLFHYSEQNSDLTHDPEMCFLVIDERRDFKVDFDKLKVIPYMYKNAYADIYQDSIIMEDSTLKKFLRKQQKDQTEFANMWLVNIREQGFLK